jgi:hypothetical protein
MKKNFKLLFAIIFVLVISAIAYYFYSQNGESVYFESARAQGKALNQQKILLIEHNLNVQDRLVIADLKNKTITRLTDNITLHRHSNLVYAETGEIFLNTWYSGGEGGALPYNKNLIFKANAWFPSEYITYSYRSKDNSFKKITSGDYLNGNVTFPEVSFKDGISNPYGIGTAKTLDSGDVVIELDGTLYDYSWMNIKDFTVLGWLY